MTFQTLLTPAQIEAFTSQGFWVNRVITDYLDEAAAATPDKAAFIDPRRQLTFAGLRREVDHCALGLAELGVGPGDVVSFQLGLQERACACVVLKPGAAGFTLGDMRQFLQEKGVAKNYWPERLDIMAALPRTASGKIQKFQLRDALRAQA